MPNGRRETNVPFVENQWSRVTQVYEKVTSCTPKWPHQLVSHPRGPRSQHGPLPVSGGSLGHFQASKSTFHELGTIAGVDRGTMSKAATAPTLMERLGCLKEDRHSAVPSERGGEDKGGVWAIEGWALWGSR